MVASARNSLNTIEQLLILGANIWIKASNDMTALDWANHMNHKEAAELIQSYSDQVILLQNNLKCKAKKQVNKQTNETIKQGQVIKQSRNYINNCR